MQLQFTVDSALLGELGEKLVETVHLALVELVKNCYDADATEVDIVFAKNDRGVPQIAISDNGTGMNFSRLEAYWMRIATTNKKERDVSSVFGRPLTGAKGIGRFCCRRLGTHLTLITQGTMAAKFVGEANNLERTTVDFPWTQFKPGTEVTSINCQGHRDRISRGKTGTTLVISGLSEEWNTHGFNWLQRQLAVLAANRGTRRKGFDEDPGFNIRLTTPDFKGTVRDLRSALMDAGWGTLKAKINREHHVVCDLVAKGLGTKTITSASKFSELKDVNLEIAIMVPFKDEMRNKEVLSLGTMRELLPQWGGVQVRYRGFRVYPYGDDDWLEIDYDRALRKGNPKGELFSFAQSLKGVDANRSLLNLLSMRNYVGNVFIGQNADGFEMKANREGFLASPAIDELKEFVRFSIHWATILRDSYLRKQDRENAIQAKSEFEDAIGQGLETGQVVDAALGYIDSEIKTISRSLPRTERKQVESSFSKATQVIRQFNASNQSELAHLRLIASTSTLLLIFSHEVKSLLGLLEQSKNSLTRISSTLPRAKSQPLLRITNSFADLNKRLEELLDLTSLIGKDHRKSKPIQVALKDKISTVENVFRLITNKYDIRFDYDSVPNNLVINRILEAELLSIVLNVVSNSVKSVIAAGKDRRIQISAKRERGINAIHIRDTGLGIHQSQFEEVFTPFIADPDGRLYKNLNKRLNPEDRFIVGSGSGLGLGIVREIVNAHNGSINFVRPQKGWNADLEIRLP